MAAQLCLFDTEPQTQHGATWWHSGWQMRNFHGFLQDREDGDGPWQFIIVGFCGEPETDDEAIIYRINDCGHIAHCHVPIDAKDRLLINGRRYGRDHWRH